MTSSFQLPIHNSHLPFIYQFSFDQTILANRLMEINLANGKWKMEIGGYCG